jgi:GT2 family glycosyltransferase
VDVVIPNWNGAATLPRLLAALRNQTVPPRRIIIVDDDGEDDSKSFMTHDFPELTVVRNPKNLGFAGTANRGIALSEGEFCALLNNDAWPEPEWLEQSLAHFSRPEVVAVAALMLRDSAPDVVDNAGLNFAWRKGAYPRYRGARVDEPALRKCHRVFMATGGAAVFRRSYLPAGNLFDEALVAYNEDADLGWRFMAADLQVDCCVKARVLHEGGRSYPHASAKHAYLQTGNEIKVLFGNLPLGGHPVATLTLLFHIARQSLSYTLKHGQGRAVGKGLLDAYRTRSAWRAARRQTRLALGRKR